MSNRVRLLQACAIVAAVVLLGWFSKPAKAYVEAPMTLGDVIRQSTNIMQMQVLKVDREKNLIIYKKLQDIKGKHPSDEIKHNIGRGGLRAGEWEEIMKWAEVGKQATFFHNGGASETYISATWYRLSAGRAVGMSHGDVRCSSSRQGRRGLRVHRRHSRQQGSRSACMVDGDKEVSQEDRAHSATEGKSEIDRLQPERDFVGWGGEEIRAPRAWPGSISTRAC